VAAGSGIDHVLGIPAAVLMSLGVVLIGYGSLLWTVASLPTVPIPGAWTVVVGNLVWVAASITAVAADWWTATGAGTAVILAQAVAVAGFAGLQILGLRTERGGTP
jgi:hypothetical protein